MSELDDLQRQFVALQKRVDNLVKPEVSNRWEGAISRFLAIPGLVGFWSMSSVQRSTGNAYDLSGQGRTLTYNGNPTYNIYNNFVPYIDLDGTGDFLSRADETDLDILGSETVYASGVRGLTLGGWFWLDALSGGTARGFINKYTGTGNQRSYTLILATTDAPRFVVSSDGINDTLVTSASTLSTGQWYFLVARFVPSTSLDVYVNSVKTTNTTSIPAALFASTANLDIGRFNQNSANVMDGRTSLCFLSANTLPDALINALFHQSRLLFGV
jgi:hypothetical protein